MTQPENLHNEDKNIQNNVNPLEHAQNTLDAGLQKQRQAKKAVQEEVSMALQTNTTETEKREKPTVSQEQVDFFLKIFKDVFHVQKVNIPTVDIYEAIQEAITCSVNKDEHIITIYLKQKGLLDKISLNKAPLRIYEVVWAIFYLSFERPDITLQIYLKHILPPMHAPRTLRFERIKPGLQSCELPSEIGYVEMTWKGKYLLSRPDLSKAHWEVYTVDHTPQGRTLHHVFNIFKAADRTLVFQQNEHLTTLKDFLAKNKKDSSLFSDITDPVLYEITELLSHWYATSGHKSDNVRSYEWKAYSVQNQLHIRSIEPNAHEYLDEFSAPHTNHVFTFELQNIPAHKQSQYSVLSRDYLLISPYESTKDFLVKQRRTGGDIIHSFGKHDTTTPWFTPKGECRGIFVTRKDKLGLYDLESETFKWLNIKKHLPKQYLKIRIAFVKPLSRTDVLVHCSHIDTPFRFAPSTYHGLPLIRGRHCTYVLEITPNSHSIEKIQYLGEGEMKCHHPYQIEEFLAEQELKMKNFVQIAPENFYINDLENNIIHYSTRYSEGKPLHNYQTISPKHQLKNIHEFGFEHCIAHVYDTENSRARNILYRSTDLS